MVETQVKTPFDLQKFLLTFREKPRINFKEVPAIFDVLPRVVCADGFSVSVQASRYHYCSPRKNPDEVRFYTEVELGFPSERVEEWLPYCEDDTDPLDTVYARVPLNLVMMVLNDFHGGVVGTEGYSG